MTQLANRPGTAVMPQNSKSDYVRQLEAAAAAIGNASIQYVKFQKGYWLLGRDALPFPNNEFYFLPNLQNITYGWQCWRNQQCIEDRWYSAGERLPDKTSLPDHGPYSKQNDGWQQSVRMELILMPDANAPVQEAVLGLFVSSSKGGLGAVSKLLREFSKGLKTGRLETDQIIVHATTGSYMHKQYGQTATPEFVLTEWLGEAEAYALMESYGVSLPPVHRASAPVIQQQAQPVYAQPAAPQVQQPVYAPPAPAPVAPAAPRRFGSAPLVQQPQVQQPVQPVQPVYAAPPVQQPPWEGANTIPPQQVEQPVYTAPAAPPPPRTFGGSPAAPAVAQPAAPPVRRFVAAAPQPVAVQPVVAQPVAYAAPAAPAPAPVAAPAPAPVAEAPPPAQAAPEPAQAVQPAAPAAPVARRGHPRRPPAPGTPAQLAAPAGAGPVNGAGVDAALGDGSV